MASVLDRASRVALDLLFPPRCALCDAGGTLLCDTCAIALPPADGHRCWRCWTAIERADGEAAAGICHDCARTTPHFAAVRSAYQFERGARRLAHQLKYDGLTSLAPEMARLMCDRVSTADADLVVPVPLHSRRERSRGYNHAALIAKPLAAALALPFDARALRRTRATSALHHTLKRAERRQIVRGAFRAEPARVEDRRILLVDDIITTGMTLDDCAEALLAAGARSVRGATWARAGEDGANVRAAV